ncbi:MAG: hypothetical protein LBP54_07940 [Campylobacteraceae bacterium]|jgi:uncharacterized protein|nr:hypothetical protein [Campylobacteraceae bacterium]
MGVIYDLQTVVLIDDTKLFFKVGRNMKKLLLLLTLSTTLLLSASFDCNKAKTDIEKLICSDEELSKLDDELGKAYNILRTYFAFEEDYTCGRYKHNGKISACEVDKALRLDNELIKVYKTFIAKNKEETKKQREWLKQTNLCEDEECVKQAYKTRIDEINKEIKTISGNLLKAQKTAKESFKKTNSVVEPIHILDRVNANALIKIKPAFLTDKEYVSLLHDYAYYLSLRAGTVIYETDRPLWEYIKETLDDMVHLFDSKEGIRYIHSDGRRLDEALKALLKAKEINPNDISISKLLAKTYLKLLVFNRTGSMCPRSRDCLVPDGAYDKIPYLMKQAYLDYVKLSKAKGTEPELDEIELSIVNRQRMFYEVLSSFAGDVSLVNYYHPSEYHIEDPKFKDICKEYVAMLNKLPDDNLTLCSRYANEDNSSFEFVKYDDAPDEYKEDTYASGRDNNRYYFLVKYKDIYFLDHYDALYLADKPDTISRDKDNFCIYQYVDLSFKDQHEYIYNQKNGRINNQESCYSIKNYDQIYKNGKE